MNKNIVLKSIVAEIERRGVPVRLVDHPTTPQERQAAYLAVRLRFLTPTSIDAAIGDAEILIESLGQELRRAA